MALSAQSARTRIKFKPLTGTIAREFSKAMEDFSNSLSVIVPVRNEEQSIAFVLSSLREHLPKAEILVIDGGSDSTGAKVIELAKKDRDLIYFRNVFDRGKGHAIREGVRLASRDFIAQFDSDLQFMPADLVRMLKTIVEDRADFICGSRFLPNSRRLKDSVPPHRDFGNRALSLYASILLNAKLTDVLAGIKMWKKAVTDEFELRSDDYCYEAELPIKAFRLGYRVMDVSVDTAPREFGESSVRPWKTGFTLLRTIPKFRWEKLK